MRQLNRYTLSLLHAEAKALILQCLHLLYIYRNMVERFVRRPGLLQDLCKIRALAFTMPMVSLTGGCSCNSRIPDDPGLLVIYCGRNKPRTSPHGLGSVQCVVTPQCAINRICAVGAQTGILIARIGIIKE